MSVKGIEKLPENCSKLDHCEKMTMILDKDLLDFQYREAAEAVCGRCDKFEPKEVKDSTEKD